MSLSSPSSSASILFYSSFENWLQTLALVAVFLNLSIGVTMKMDTEDDPEINTVNDSIMMSVLLVVVNVMVILVLLGEFLTPVISGLVRY